MSKRINVTVSITLSKQMEIEVDRCSEEDLLRGVLTQHLLPYEAGEYVNPEFQDEFSGWFTDDFAVVQEPKRDYE